MRTKIFILTLAFLSIHSPAKSQADTPATCYRFSMPDSPANSASLTRERAEVWCYQKISQPVVGTYIYNADSEVARPELSILIEPDGIMTHGSLLSGDLSVHRLKAAQFNPFSIPLKEPKFLPTIFVPHTEQFSESLQKNLNFLMSQPPLFEDFAIQEGESNQNASIKPWRGYWWPYKGQPLYGSSSSPLAKYDKFVKARTGSNPGARSWESANHSYSGTWWEGHCNGWAASSVLRRQPTSSKTDSASGVTFSVADIKGILAETDYCANVAFFGKRYRGSSSNLYDISPGSFHRTLTYYIGSLGKPVAVDYRRDSAVDNHVISGYTTNISRTGSNTYAVTTVVRIHKYDGTRNTSPGTAPQYTRTYKYTLRESSDGSLSGSWRSTNPDFLWVPLSTGDCNSNNARIRHSRVQEILDL
jgi:hypothetical protein